jgi:hypothetical protein
MKGPHHHHIKIVLMGKGEEGALLREHHHHHHIPSLKISCISCSWAEGVARRRHEPKESLGVDMSLGKILFC